MGCIFFSEKNIHGAWVVYGALGIRQFYGYSKREAERLYRQEAKRKLVFNQSR